MFINRMTEFILMETDQFGHAGDRSELRAIQVALWLQMATPSGDRLARLSGNEKGCLPEYSMDDELDLNQLLFKKMEELRCDYLSPMVKARVEYEFFLEWLDRGGGK